MVDDLGSWWADGDGWVHLPRGIRVPSGRAVLVSLDGATRSVDPTAIARYRVPDADAVRSIGPLLGVRPASQVVALFVAVARAVGVDRASSLPEVRRAFLPLLKAISGDAPSLDALRERCRAIADAATGPDAALVREVLVALPERLVASSAEVEVEVAPPDGPHAEAIAAATELLARFANLDRGAGAELAASLLQPTEDDVARCFVPAARGAVSRASASLWAEAPAPLPKPGQVRLTAVAATVAELRSGLGAAGSFPAGYARIAAQLAPGPLWLCWRWTEPGHTAGMRYDGLVRLDHGWVWFPKPWRMIEG